MTARIIPRFRLVASSGALAMGCGVLAAAQAADGPMSLDAWVSLAVLAVLGGVLATVGVSRRLRRAELSYRRLFESAPDGIVTVDPQGRIFRVNSQALKIFGYVRGELLGKPLETLLPERFRKPHIEHRGGYVARPLVRPMGRGLPLMGLRKGGVEFPVDISLSSERTESGVFVTAFIRDISARRQAEDEKNSLLMQLAQTQKMESVGRLAGGVAHDFNNILTAIKGYGGFVRDGLAADDPRRADVLEILSAADRAVALTRQLLAFSRRQVLAPQVVDLNRVVADMTNMLIRLIGEDVRLSTRLSPGPCRVRVDVGQAEQVIMNLTINARDALPKGGSIAVETEIAALGDDFFASHPDLRPGPLVCLRVSDTGCGMTEDVKSRIFEPFFTTKGEDKGTGLGLATVLGIVKQSEGEIEVESSPNSGTIFRVYFPQVEAALPDEGGYKAVDKETTARGHETVLLVEEDGSILRLAERALIAGGYKVLTALNGREALKIIEERGKPVDLLVADAAMPGMSGRELAREISRRNMACRTLFVSGTMDESIAPHGVLEPGLAFLCKPFSSAALLSKLRAVLDGPADQAKA